MKKSKLILPLLVLVAIFTFTLVSTHPIMAAGNKESAKETVDKAKKKVKKSADKTKAALSKKLNINKATKDELMMLPGIGEARAEAIIKARKKKPFADLKDVVERKIGVGGKIIEDIKPYLTFN